MVMNVNEGANGFHLFTVVTDGYGNYIAEGQDGKEIARVESTGEDDNRQAALDLCNLVLRTLTAMDPDGEAGGVPTDVQVA